ncbi:hypothetical protein GCM10023149_20840 [Mucilaginibacter gynuensis]|uniref:Uncharacterized protein n=2 Tax=Mucilaginibacter gynuensis TaxID=1302236 RepID=A0ABP8GBU5_9SPHI
MSGSVEKKVPEGCATATFKKMYIQLAAASGEADVDYLEKTQKGITSFTESLGVKRDYHFQTKAINNYRVLITHETTNNMVNTYTFYCVAGDRKSVLTGVIEYPKNGEVDAKSELDKLLASIKFK